MSEYEDYLIREATEGPSFQEVHEDYLEPEPVEPNDSTETGDEQRARQNKFTKEVAISLHTETRQSGRRKYRYGGK